MVKSSHAFTAMNAGELSPLLDARVDKEFYGVGLKSCLNMIPLTQGPAAMRSGFQYVKEVKSSANRTALIRFQFGLTQAYVIEVGDQYFRFYKDHAVITATATNITGITQANPGVVTSNAHGLANGDKVIVSGVLGMIELNNREFTVAGATANTFQLSGVNTTGYAAYTSGGTVAKIIEVATPYTQANLFDSAGVLQLSFAQSADTLYIAHSSYPLRKLTRTSHTSWTLSTVTLLNGPFAAMNSDDTKHVYCTGVLGGYPGTSIGIVSNSAIFESSHVGGLFFLEERYFADNDVKPWAPAAVHGGVGSQCSNDGNVYVMISASGTSTGPVAPIHTDGDAEDNIQARARWRYLHSRWAIVEITAFSSSTIVSGIVKTYLCDGLIPNAKNVSLAANNGAGLIRLTVNAHGFTTGDYVHVQSVGGTTEANASWKISVVDTNRFDLVGSAFVNAYTASGNVKRYSTWKWAHGAFSGARGYPSAVAFYQDRLCLAATTSDPDTIWMSEASSYESFAQRDANQITAANSITVTLSDGEVNTIEALQGSPDGLVVLSADSESAIQQATVNEPLGPNNVRAVPLSNYGAKHVRPVRVGNAVMFVQRGGRKVRELLQSDQGFQANDVSVRAEHLTAQYGIVSMDWAQEPDALLWCARSDGTLLGFTYQKEQNVFAWGRHQLGGYSDSGNTLAPVVESVCTVPNSDGSENELWLIVKRYINGGTKRYIEYLKPRWVFGSSVSSGFFVDSGLTYSGSAATVISGLNWLIGQSVTILADGKVHPAKTVAANGSITLDYSASTVHVGLGFGGRIQLPRPETQQPDGTSQGKAKSIRRVTYRVIDTNNLKFGSDFATMTRVNFRRTTDPIGSAVPLMTGDKVQDFAPPPGDSDGTICIENDYPYPFCIAGVFPTVEVY